MNIDAVALVGAVDRVSSTNASIRADADVVGYCLYLYYRKRDYLTFCQS